MQRPKKLYSSSSEEEDDQDNYIPAARLMPKSAVVTQNIGSAPIIELRDEHLDVSRSEGEEEED